MWPGPDSPYQNLPALPPAANVESASVLKAAIRPSRLLAALNEACHRLSDPAILTNTIPLLEAQASSEIENIVTTNDELFRAAHNALPQPQSPAMKEALRYRDALRIGNTEIELRPLTINTAIKVCSVIVGHDATLRSDTGTYIGNPLTKARIYTPPEGTELLREHLAKWEHFIHSDHTIDPIIKVALQHYQFEAIHPLHDGNGRTGRVINSLCLSSLNLLEFPILYLSGYIVRNKDSYYANLRKVTERDDWEGWILYFLGAIERTADWTLQLIGAIDVLQKEMEEQIRGINSHPLELTKLAFARPYLRADDIVKVGLSQRQAAARWLDELANNRILAKERVGRSTIYTNHRLLDVLFNTPLS